MLDGHRRLTIFSGCLYVAISTYAPLVLAAPAPAPPPPSPKVVFDRKAGRKTYAQMSANERRADDLRAESESFMRRGNFDQAREILLRAVKLDPNSPGIYFALGRSSYNTLERFGKGVDEAEKYFKKAISLDPGRGTYYVKLAELEVIRGHHQKAIDYCNQSLACKYKDGDAFYFRAISYSALGKTDLAVADINRQIEYCKTTANDIGVGKFRSYDAKASILENAGKFGDALAAYKELYAMNGQDSFIFRQAECLTKMGKFLEATQILSTLLKKNPHDEAAYAARARIYMKMHDYPRAEQDFTSSIDELPSGRTYRERAEVYKKMGKMDLYRRDLQTAENP